MIIGLTGKKMVGKDTVGRHLIKQHGFERIGFADKLKEAVAALFDIDVVQVDEFKSDDRNKVTVMADWYDSSDRNPDPAWVASYMKPMNWRTMLQRFGTEMGRNVFGEDFWVDQALPMAYGMEFSEKNIVVTDVRFENEARRILDLGGKIIEIRRPTEHVDKHVSEAGIPDYMMEYVITNDSTLESLYKDVDAVLESIDGNSW